MSQLSYVDYLYVAELIMKYMTNEELTIVLENVRGRGAEKRLTGVIFRLLGLSAL